MGNTEKPGPDQPITPPTQISVKGDLTPVQLTALTALAIFLGEVLIMFVMPLFGELPVAVGAIVDSVLLTLLAAPVLSFLLFRPMVVQIAERTKAEQALRKLNEGLEQEVEARTEELTRSNKVLHREVEERKATEDRLVRSNDFIRRLIETAPCIMATLDAGTLQCHYVNGRIEDFLGHSPDMVAASGAHFIDSIMEPAAAARCRELIRSMADSAPGEIARAELEFGASDGRLERFRVGVVVCSRTPIGEAEEVLLVATPVNP